MGRDTFAIAVIQVVTRGPELCAFTLCRVTASAAAGVRSGVGFAAG